MKILRNTLWTAVGLFALAALTALPVAADQQILDDLIVDGSICAGLDCVNGESFGFDTLRLKENNLRIKFQDTSTSASFPTQDWQLTANDSSNGGANRFSIECVSPGSSNPFTVEGCAPTNSLFVDDGGRIGFGTGTPVVELHVVDGDTPTLRLEQDGSSGFTPQTWDLAGNETNIFIRDATNGSTLPFRIRPGAPTSAIDVAGSGNVGIGTSSPSESLHVRRTDGTVKLLVEEDNGTATGRELLELRNNGNPQFIFRNDDNGNEWKFQTFDTCSNGQCNADGSTLALVDNSDATREFQVTAAGNTLISGANYFTGSSRSIKKDFETVDGVDILRRLSGMPMTEWSEKADTTGRRHIGPIAEDFYATFGLGADSKTLSMTDVGGVALAAIQGLNQEIRVRDLMIRELLERVGALEARLAD